MAVFSATLIFLIGLTLFVQVILRMKIIGGNKLGIIAGRGGKNGFVTLSGGRAFIIPLFNRYTAVNLMPYTIDVTVKSSIADGVVPLNVKATVSFAIASSPEGRSKAVTRLLSMTDEPELLKEVASDIIEGHLRDVIASMTPEQVMQDKDQLVANMINVCKTDLENIGLEISTMNIADVDDHRLDGVDDPELYIALLKRIQTVYAECQARTAKAESLARSVEEEEKQRTDIEVRKYTNMYENLVAETRVAVAEHEQRGLVGMEDALKSADAEVAGLKSKIAAEKEKIVMLKTKLEAEVVTPALAQKEKMILDAKIKAAGIRGEEEALIEQLNETIRILKSQGEQGAVTYLIDNFKELITPFAETLTLFDVDNVSVITGMEGDHQPISAVHPHAADSLRNNLLENVFRNSLGEKASSPKGKEPEDLNLTEK
ncbi:MAG: SPFH domain-containing protein [Spirochaetales bacterium]|nr:SPFH domain-containing protein [Spirochaetales bacterium]